MNNILASMLSGYELRSDYDRKNAMKEIIQEIVLCSLSRTDFFKHAAFYGGTALRIFYGLDRFSEDLDFSLKEPDDGFDLSAYLPALENEVRSYGLNLKAEVKAKTKESFVQSAFVKGKTREQLLLFYPDESISSLVPANETVKIKFEVDTNPPPFAGYEKQYRLLPIPYEVGLYDAPSLFAGKIHAVLCRGWKNRVKGRDLYDFVFYVSRKIPVNLPHLNARLEDSGFIPDGTSLTIQNVKEALCERFASIDYVNARQDVLPFIKNPASLDVWSADFFTRIAQDVNAV
ncbi:MAG: nucleotidyl transferase AbiEii/AbiGii toxin family protein [Clostridia bacterium]|nr:nucleotidyl transferase AbiEii/AbiGii toxin family protein [Clostridia bacterium]